MNTYNPSTCLSLSLYISFSHIHIHEYDPHRYARSGVLGKIKNPKNCRNDTFRTIFCRLKFDTDLSILDGAQTVSKSVLQSGSPALFTNAECRRCPWISSMRVFASDFLLKRTQKKPNKKNSNWKCVFITLRIHPKNQPLQLQNACNAILAITVHYCATIESNRIDCIHICERPISKSHMNQIELRAS